MILNLNKSELRVWLSLTFILSQFVLKVLNQEIATSTSSMSCVCDGNCERVQESECPWGITLDVCGCCFVCARGENEPCGGALGNCAAGLNCQLEEGEGSESEKTGTCTKTTEDCSNSIEKFGCGVESGKCTCRMWSGCSEHQQLFLFDSEDECKSRIAFLLTQSQDTNVNPSLSLRILSTEEDKGYMDDEDEDEDCAGVECDESLQCPADSHRSPRLVQDSGLRHSSSQSGCCVSLSEICQCNPPSACPEPSCPLGATLKLLRAATNTPGLCCPTHSCEDKD